MSVCSWGGDLLRVYLISILPVKWGPFYDLRTFHLVLTTSQVYLRVKTGSEGSVDGHLLLS